MPKRQKITRFRLVTKLPRIKLIGKKAKVRLVAKIALISKFFFIIKGN
tara:strand:- start:560 stop:703 length:144 start_codon:yes stop_codon:yes gene_type:complete